MEQDQQPEAGLDPRYERVFPAESCSWKLDDYRVVRDSPGELAALRRLISATSY